jgi:hypothetical protein
LRFDVEQRLPDELPLPPTRFAFDSPETLFMTVENWIGEIQMQQPFTLGNPINILPIYFVQLPELPTIADIEVQSATAFIGGGSQLLIAHTDSACYLVPIATADFSFDVRDVELEGDRIYVGGLAGEQLHIAILDRPALPEIVTLGVLTFEPAQWSVVGDELLTLNLDELTLAATNIAEPGLGQTREIPLDLDPEWRLMGTPELVDDNFSVLVWDMGLLSITGLLGPEPALNWHMFSYYMPIYFLSARGEHLFVGINFADAGYYGSSVYIATLDPEDALVQINLYPHYPVGEYYPIRDDVVFAFSNTSLIVLDLSAPEGRELVRTYPLRYPY